MPDIILPFYKSCALEYCRAVVAADIGDDKRQFFCGQTAMQQQGMQRVQNGLAFFEDHVIIRGDMKDKKKVSLLKYREIVLIKTNGDHLYWYTSDGEQVSIRITMNFVEEKLQAHQLIRCHRSWIVNSDYTLRLEVEQDGSASLLLTTAIEVLTTSRTHKKKLIKQRIEKVPVGGSYLSLVEKFFNK